jgi:hypothetical protein
MTHYDKLIDAIKQELYEHHINTVVWDEKDANETSQRILEIVEEFQQTRLTPRWRASD